MNEPENIGLKGNALVDFNGRCIDAIQDIIFEFQTPVAVTVGLNVANKLGVWVQQKLSTQFTANDVEVMLDEMRKGVLKCAEESKTEDSAAVKDIECFMAACEGKFKRIFAECLTAPGKEGPAR